MRFGVYLKTIQIVTVLVSITSINLVGYIYATSMLKTYTQNTHVGMGRVKVLVFVCEKCSLWP